MFRSSLNSIVRQPIYVHLRLKRLLLVRQFSAFVGDNRSADDRVNAVGCEQTTDSTEMDYPVCHDKHNTEFYIKITNESGLDEKAVVQYSWVSPGVVDLHHTEVPVAFRGKGIAKILAKAALDHFAEENAQMKLSCTYLQKYFKDNPLEQYTRCINSHI